MTEKEVENSDLNKRFLVNRFWDIFLWIVDPLNVKNIFFGLSDEEKERRIKEMRDFASSNNLSQEDILDNTAYGDKLNLNTAKQLWILKKVFPRVLWGIARWVGISYILSNGFSNTQSTVNTTLHWAKEKNSPSTEFIGNKMDPENRKIFTSIKTYLEFHRSSLSADKIEHLEGTLDWLSNRWDEKWIGLRYLDLIKEEFPVLYNNIVNNISNSKTITRNTAKTLTSSL